MKFLILFLLASTNALAGIEQAPQNFIHNTKKAVFVDFLRADYEITYEANNQRAYVVSKIEFDMPTSGFPLFDSIAAPNWVKLNGRDVEQKLIRTPDRASKVRMVDQHTPKGLNILEIKTPIIKGTYFRARRGNWNRVSSGFFIRDLADRMFLEQYIPTNYEYDQYQMNFDVRVTGTKRWHSLFANGKVNKVSENHYQVSFPSWYTASSLYFHLVPINRFVRYYLKYKSIDGREIPVTIYSTHRFYNYLTQKKTWRVMKELEHDYGPYPHDQLIIYGTGIKGGMEHAGATETSLKALGHELQHMYFAKCIHPANGNSGWLDEAIASWRDKGHKTKTSPFYKSVNLGAHSQYTRKTDKKSYKYGRSFMAYIDHKLKEIGKPGLKDFLRVFFEDRKYTTITTKDFIKDLENYAQMSFGEEFNQYVFGKMKSFENQDEDIENPFHPPRSEEDLRSII